jgi:sterol desaturase/sphingolipid hydroxylase (fatty acid hydroxylase superfamily)
MGQNLLADAPAWLADAASVLSAPFDIGFGSRLHYLNFIVFVAAGAIVFWIRGHKETGAQSPLAYIFPKQMYLSQSSLVDLKIYIANHYFTFQAAGIKLISGTVIAGWTAGALEPALGGSGIDGRQFWALAVCALLIAMANDFATYLTHRLSHQNTLLWPFHKVHHSAESLTPLTLYRKHPLYELFKTAVHSLIAGPVVGVIAVVFDQYGFWAILGINAIYMVFNFAGSNLRHSHIWIGFGPVLSRVFISPAMHQIHHSIDPRHYDKNYGEVFALWDWMFGTIYIPKSREQITFGVTDEISGERVQPHPTLVDAYVVPVREFARLVSRQKAKQTPKRSVASANAA